MTDIWEAFVKRWAKQTQKSEAKIKPNKSLWMYKTKLRIFFEDVVAATRQEGMLNSQAKQQGSTEAPRKLTSEAAPQDKEPAQTTSEAKPKDTQVDKDLTSEAKPKEIVTTMTMKAAPRDNKTTKTTSEAKPKDKHVNKDLTLETEKKEKVSKATSEAAPEHKKDLREKIRAKATADLNKSEAKGRMHKLPSSLQQLNKIETMKTDVPKFNWADRSAHKARSNDLKVKLQFFMEAITFDANTPDKERGNLHRTPNFEDIIKESPGFHNRQLFYKEAKQAAFRHLNNFQAYQDLLANGSMPVFKIKFITTLSIRTPNSLNWQQPSNHGPHTGTLIQRSLAWMTTRAP